MIRKSSNNFAGWGRVADVWRTDPRCGPTAPGSRREPASGRYLPRRRGDEASTIFITGHRLLRVGVDGVQVPRYSRTPHRRSHQRHSRTRLLLIFESFR